MGSKKNIITFPNIPGVVAYLKGLGFKISMRQAYRHEQSGRIRKSFDGNFELAAVEKYSRQLKRIDGTQADASADPMQKEKMQAEIKKLTAQAEHWDLKAKITSGQYVPRDEFERALAARAMLFKSGLENFFMMKASEIISMCGGDQKKTPDFIQYMLDQVGYFLEAYTQDREFEIFFDTSDPEAKTEEEDEDEEAGDEDELGTADGDTEG